MRRTGPLVMSGALFLKAAGYNHGMQQLLTLAVLPASLATTYCLVVHTYFRYCRAVVIAISNSVKPQYAQSDCKVCDSLI